MVLIGSDNLLFRRWVGLLGTASIVLSLPLTFSLIMQKLFDHRHPRQKYLWPKILLPAQYKRCTLRSWLKRTSKHINGMHQTKIPASGIVLKRCIAPRFVSGFLMCWLTISIYYFSVGPTNTKPNVYKNNDKMQKKIQSSK